MKKLILTLSMAITMHFSSFAQWTTVGTNIYNDNTGNVGIGTTTPNSKLEVVSGSSDPFNLNGSYNKIKASLGETIIESFHNTSFVIDATGSYNNRYFRIGSGASYINGGSPVELFRVQENGNVGISTTNPVHKLEVVSGTSDPFYLNGTYNKIKATSGETFIESYHNTSFVIDADGNYNDRYFKISKGASYINGGTPVELFRVQENGNVGIGTISPDEKLTVNGTIHSTEVKVTASVPVPDYVFQLNYKLKDLTDLKDYIDQNHHLPEIPSAKEIEKNGIGLGEMNMKLLKKVEELTLYVIEAKNDNTKLKKKNRELKQDLKKITQVLVKNHIQ